MASEEEVEALAQQDAQMQAMQETMAAVGGAAGVAEQVGKAEQAMAGAE
jgi:oligoribonuclease (3'-5' exoribonuclease)